MKKPKKTSAPANPKLSKTLSLRIEIDPDLLPGLRALPKEDRTKVGELIQKVRHAFGFPHLHQGTGIRDLGTGVYECRYGLQIRLLFTAHKRYLYFHMMGNHDQVKRFLKNL